MRAFFRYLYHGLHIASELVLSEWEPFAYAGEPADADVEISFCAASVSPDEDGHAAVEAGPDYTLDVNGVGFFRIRDGREILITPAKGASARAVRVYLMGSAWAVLLYQRRALLLHASAVAVADGAALFCGQRGSGKSTLAAVLCSGGLRLISDDLCCLDIKNDCLPVVHASTPRFKLWNDAVRQLEWTGKKSEAGLIVPKSHFSEIRGITTGTLPVRAVYLLSWGEPGIQRITGFAALRRLMRAATYRGDLLMASGDAGFHVQTLTKLIADVPIWEYRRPRELPDMERNAGKLREHFSNLVTGIR